MTIKICKEKTEKRLESFGKVLGWICYFIIWILLVATIYYTFEWTTNEPDVPFKWGALLVTGYLITIFALIGIDGVAQVGLIARLNQKYKLIEWNRDC